MIRDILLVIFIIILLFLPNMYYNLIILLFGFLTYIIIAILPVFVKGNKIIDWLNRKII